MTDNATLSDIEFGRQVGRFRRRTVAISAAVGYDCDDDSRRAHPLRTAPRARLGAPERVVSRAFRGRGPVFRRRGAVRPRFRRQIRPAVGRRLAPPPRAEKRRRGGAKPAQPARGRVCAARRGRPREARRGARAGGTGLFRLPRRSPIAATLSAPSASPRSRPTCRRRSIRRKAAELAAALRETGGRGRPAPIAAAAAAEAVIALRADAEPLALLRRRRAGQKPRAGQRRCRSSPASCSPAAARGRDGGRARARPAG